MDGKKLFLPSDTIPHGVLRRNTPWYGRVGHDKTLYDVRSNSVRLDLLQNNEAVSSPGGDTGPRC